MIASVSVLLPFSFPAKSKVQISTAQSELAQLYSKVQPHTAMLYRLLPGTALLHNVQHCLSLVNNYVKQNVCK